IQKLGFLPEPQTDFIMAIIAEELGIKGVAIVLVGLGFIVARSLIIAMTTKDPLARMIAGGIGAWIGFQTFVNLGGITGLIPLTGVTLPFISYGGSSIMLLSLALGILMNISMFHKREKRKII
ncbi:MAG: FtsW/RodA/SpoVE family cell cycle protein, partial [Lysinibacillus sp.]